ncbi:MAG: hypothetical protein IKG67_12740 [Parasporobacterium sp.]|nr:hypothetical protein [Parasporobacterium sp.]
MKGMKKMLALLLAVAVTVMMAVPALAQPAAEQTYGFVIAGGQEEAAPEAIAEEAAPGESPAGEAPGESPQGESPEGESPAGEAPAGESAGGSEGGESAPGGSEEAAAPEPLVGQVITETLTFEDGVTLEEDNLYIPEEGYGVIMTVDGQVVTQAPGTYEGKVVFEVVPLTDSHNEQGEYFHNKSLVTRNTDNLVVVESGVNGEITEDGMKNADITADAPNISVVTVTGGEYAIEDSKFHTLQTGNHASGGNDFTGDGCAIAATGASVLHVRNFEGTGDGVTRTVLYGGLSDRNNYPTIYVSDSKLTSTGDIEGEDCAVWVLGLHGVVRTCQFCDYYDVYYYNTLIQSFGWACLSVDGTEYPWADDLAELTAAYVEGEGYANADGEIMELNEFAVAATGLTDEYLATLAAVDSAEALEALPQTNDYSLYYFPGKNTLVNSELDILDMDQGRTGYSSYSIGANINVYSNCVVNADYGNVEANEYASSAYVNGTTVNARKSIVMCHSNAGGITMCADSVLNADEIAFVYKGTGEGYVQEMLDDGGDDGGSSGGMMVASATGSNLYVRNCDVNAPVLVLAFDSDDPGALGGTEVDFDDSIAGKDENFDVTETNFWGKANTMMWPEDSSYQYNAAVEAYFEDCIGDTALEGDIFNCHQYTSKNLILTLDNSELTGIISSGWCEHAVDGIERSLPYGDDLIETEDGRILGCRENLGRVTCYPSETVNNGMIVTLKNGAVWNVTETSYVSVLNVDDTSVVNGQVTILDNGLIQVDPAAEAAQAPAESPEGESPEGEAPAGAPAEPAEGPVALEELPEGDVVEVDTYSEMAGDITVYVFYEMVDGQPVIKDLVDKEGGFSIYEMVPDLGEFQTLLEEALAQ